MAIRLALLAHHYRADWEWTDEVLAQAQARLGRWRAAVAAAVPPTGATAADVLATVRARLADDLDAPGALDAVDAWADAVLAVPGGRPGRRGARPRDRRRAARGGPVTRPIPTARRPVKQHFPTPVDNPPGYPQRPPPPSFSNRPAARCFHDTQHLPRPRRLRPTRGHRDDGCGSARRRRCSRRSPGSLGFEPEHSIVVLGTGHPRPKSRSRSATTCPIRPTFGRSPRSRATCSTCSPRRA